MVIDQKTLAANISIGYKMEIPEEDTVVDCRRLYHGRLGGDFDEFQDHPMFFYAEGRLSSDFAEHKFISGDDTYMIAHETNGAEEFDAAYLAQSPVVLLFSVTIKRPVILDMARLVQIATDLNIPEPEQEEFVDGFEDSDCDTRDLVFSWARGQGYDGAIIVNDMTPKVAGGDWCFRSAYVAFAPRSQVRPFFGLGRHKPLDDGRN